MQAVFISRNITFGRPTKPSVLYNRIEPSKPLYTCRESRVLEHVMNRHSIIPLLAVCLALAGCASTAATPPDNQSIDEPVALPLPAEAESTVIVTGGSVEGTALWGDTPLSGASIELLPDDWRITGNETAIASTTSDNEGKFSITDVPTGEWSLVASWPNGERSSGGTPVVTVVAGQTITDTVVRLERPIRLIEPSLSEPGSSTPTLRWEPIEGIDSYRVLFIDMGTSEAVAQRIVTDTTMTVAEGLLQPSRNYTVVISGMNADGSMPLASFTGEYVVADVPPASTE